VFIKFHDPLDRIHRQIILAIKMSILMDKCLDDNASEPKLPAEEAETFAKAAWAFCQLITTVGQHYRSQTPPMALFNYTIKYHYLLHIAEASQYFNPRWCWCYQGEDLMNKTKNLLKSCMVANKPIPAVNKAMTKYTFGMGYQIVSFEDKLFR